jgi:prolyl oligopeptidase
VIVPQVPEPPATRRDDVVDQLGDLAVPDPFRWLEDGSSPEVQAWVGEQNAHTRSLIDALPHRNALHHRLIRLLRTGSSVGCQVAGDRVFSMDRWGPHEQAVLTVRSARTVGDPRVLVHPVALTGDPTGAIDWFHPSPDGRRVAWGLSTGGGERSTLRILDVDNEVPLADEIPHTRAASVAWAPDGGGFAYTRFPDPDEVGSAEAGYWRRVWWHRIGEPWATDELVWGDLPDKTVWPTVSISHDGRWLLVHLSIGWSRVDVHLVDRRSGAHTVMIQGIDAVSRFEVVDGRLIGLTTLDADRGRIVAADVRAAWHDRWETIVPEGEGVLEAVVPTRRSLLVLSSLSAVASLDRYDHDGSHHLPVELPGPGSLAGLSGSDRRDEAFLSFTSFAQPPTMYRWHRSGLDGWSRLRQLDLEGDGPRGEYVVEQVRFRSTDGVDVPMFLIHAADTIPDEDTPCILTGYGGFAITMAPTYSAAVVATCDLGGIYAVAGIRGGSEEGEAWHRAGMREHKQQSFDDFAAAADWLVERGVTSRPRLAVRGGSNGGLLVGATITQRPDLCRAAHCAVPLLDMVRYPQFLIAELWTPEYGDPSVPDELSWLWSYSPYHRVEDGTCYPAVLLTTAQEDSRVDPLHARKMTARLQEANACATEHPTLLREEVRAGHGQGKPVAQQADELADVLAFLTWQLGLLEPPG